MVKRSMAKARLRSCGEVFDPFLAAIREMRMADAAMMRGSDQLTSGQLSIRKKKATVELRKIIKSEVPAAFTMGVL